MFVFGSELRSGTQRRTNVPSGSNFCPWATGAPMSSLALCYETRRRVGISAFSGTRNSFHSCARTLVCGMNSAFLSHPNPPVWTRLRCAQLRLSKKLKKTLAPRLDSASLAVLTDPGSKVVSTSPAGARGRTSGSDARRKESLVFRLTSSASLLSYESKGFALEVL
jgi:hypothetical protein